LARRASAHRPAARIPWGSLRPGATPDAGGFLDLADLAAEQTRHSFNPVGRQIKSARLLRRRGSFRARVARSERGDQAVAP
jgi:hypothetical protein